MDETIVITEETIKYNEKHEMLAASIIKLPILVECFNQINKRIVNKDDIFITKDKKIHFLALSSGFIFVISLLSKIIFQLT